MIYCKKTAFQTMGNFFEHHFWADLPEIIFIFFRKCIYMMLCGLQGDSMCLYALGAFFRLKELSRACGMFSDLRSRPILTK